ncbi:MAG TPA: mucoidy inhibitor MuiA family protein, partial [Candidatus Lokiarchaeia archaeon]|nr:mucoidy inhibitor MuiA family protein [Candidatus Lokiarchaeia archaeon]
MVENLETIIDHVTIYRQGAKVTRYGKIELEEGQHTVAIELPEFIDPDSARVKGKGDGLIININLEENFRQETMREGVKELQDELEAVRKDLKFTQKRKGLLEQQKTQLSTMQDNFMSTFPKIYAAGESTVEKFMTFTTHHESQFTQVSADIRELGKKIEELTIRANILVQQLNQLGQQKEITRYYLLKVNINVRAAGEFQFYADYQSRSPFWTPVYDINLGDTAASVKIMANCINNTGEDWKDVELEVSTATMAAIRAEKPTPFIVTEFQYRPPPAPPGMARGAMAAAPMKKMARREASEEKEVMEEKVDMDEMGAMGGGFDGAAASVMNIPKAPAVREQRAQVSDAVGVQTFKLPGRVSIPSDKDPHPVTLTTTELPS